MFSRVLKAGDEHHERGTRHMEVGDEGIDHVELIARQDIEARGLAIAGDKSAPAVVGLGIPGAFQAADARGAHGDNAAACGMGRVHGVHGGLGHRVELGVDVVLLRVVLVHHAEGVQTHFQLHCGPTDAARAQTLDELGREVQPAVGAAAELSRREYTVWYSSSSPA